MRSRRFVLTLFAAGVIASGVLLSGEQLPEPRRQFGAGVTGAFEGWYTNPDGSRTFLVGYYNRNTDQALDVPIGVNNRIEPGGPDMGQPTHFLPGRRHGMFTIAVPKDFTREQKYTWTLVANGQSNTIPLRVNPDYLINPFDEISVHNTPPVLQLERNGPEVQGPVAALATAPARTASLSAPLPLTVWASDDMKFTSGSNAPPRNPPPPVRLTWSKYRGPGTVTFDKTSLAMEKLEGGRLPFYGQATVSARFSAPGDYVLHVTASDYSGEGGGGFVCCWSTAVVKVAVQQ